MQGNDIVISLVFLEGILSFFSPCILPVLPVYLSYLAGATVEEIEKSEKLKRTMFKNSIGFVLGISVVFVMLGAGASTLGKILFDYKDLLRQIGGIIIIIFGLNYMGAIRIGFLNREKKFRVKERKTGFIGAFILGVTFSFGWTPCIGQFLGHVLFMASRSDHVLEAMGLLGIYALGMVIPFLVTTFLFGKLLRNYKKIYRHFGLIKKLGGIILIIMGILTFFDLTKLML